MSDGFLSCDYSLDAIFRHDGFSSTVIDWFLPPAVEVEGIAWDGSNLLSADHTANKIYKHSGFSSSITDSFASPSSGIHDIAWDGSNLLSLDDSTSKIYKHSGFSSTITDSFASPDLVPSGLVWDGSDLLSVGRQTDKIYKHSGFSSSITDSFATPGSIGQGLDWYGGNLYSGDIGVDKLYKHEGFSSTITDSFAAPYIAPSGVVWGIAMSLPSQYGRPNGDITVGSWSPNPSSPTTLWDKIDEPVRDFLDYVFSDTDEDECEFSLTAVTDPETGLNHVIRCWAWCPGGGGKAEKMYIALVENGNVRAQSPTTTLERGYCALIEYALTEAEANAIQNYGNLRFRAHIIDVSGGEPIRITQAEFKCPAAPLTYKLEGITKDKNGNALGSCLCFLCKDNQDNTCSYIGYTLSDSVTGAYSFTGIVDNDPQYYVISWKDDTPHVFDVTDHVLQPILE